MSTLAIVVRKRGAARPGRRAATCLALAMAAPACSEQAVGQRDAAAAPPDGAEPDRAEAGRAEPDAAALDGLAAADARDAGADAAEASPRCGPQPTPPRRYWEAFEADGERWIVGVRDSSEGGPPSCSLVRINALDGTTERERVLHEGGASYCFGGGDAGFPVEGGYALAVVTVVNLGLALDDEEFRLWLVDAATLEDLRVFEPVTVACRCAFAPCCGVGLGYDLNGDGPGDFRINDGNTERWIVSPDFVEDRVAPWPPGSIAAYRNPRAVGQGVNLGGDEGPDVLTTTGSCDIRVYDAETFSELWSAAAGGIGACRASAHDFDQDGVYEVLYERSEVGVVSEGEIVWAYDSESYWLWDGSFDLDCDGRPDLRAERIDDWFDLRHWSGLTREVIRDTSRRGIAGVEYSPGHTGPIDFGDGRGVLLNPRGNRVEALDGRSFEEVWQVRGGLAGVMDFDGDGFSDLLVRTGADGLRLLAGPDLAEVWESPGPARVGLDADGDAVPEIEQTVRDIGTCTMTYRRGTDATELWSRDECLGLVGVEARP